MILLVLNSIIVFSLQGATSVITSGIPFGNVGEATTGRLEVAWVVDGKLKLPVGCLLFFRHCQLVGFNEQNEAGTPIDKSI